MDDRRRHVTLSNLGLFTIVAAAALAAVKGRSRARTGLRLLGFWAYLSVVNRGAANAGLGEISEAGHGYRRSGLRIGAHLHKVVVFAPENRSIG